MIWRYSRSMGKLTFITCYIKRALKRLNHTLKLCVISFSMCRLRMHSQPSLDSDPGSGALIVWFDWDIVNTQTNSDLNYLICECKRTATEQNRCHEAIRATKTMTTWTVMDSGSNNSQTDVMLVTLLVYENIQININISRELKSGSLASAKWTKTAEK